MDDAPQKSAFRQRANVTDLDNVIATNVRDALAVRGLSQRGFAIKLGISPQLMNAYVNGKQPIGKGTLTRISAVLDIPEYMFLQKDPFGGGSKEAFSIPEAPQAPQAPQAPAQAPHQAPRKEPDYPGFSLQSAPPNQETGAPEADSLAYPGQPQSAAGATFSRGSLTPRRASAPAGYPFPSDGATGGERNASDNLESTVVPLGRIPVISWIRAGALHEPCDVFLPGFAEEWTVYDTRDSNAFALRVVGSSMEPEFREGDIIIVSPAVEPVSGEYVVAKYRGRVTFKKLRLIDRGTYAEARLIPLNIVEHDVIEISGDEIKNLKIIGKVIGKTVRY